MTSSREPEADLVLLDACCLINLFASGHGEEILRALPYRWAIARYVVEEEMLEIEVEHVEAEDEPSSSDRGRLPLRPLLAELLEKGLLEELDVGSEEEQAELVRFAAELDDGEAHPCALAIVRHGRVATDDRKAIRVLRTAWKSRGHEGEPALRTSELLFSWADAARIARPNLVQIVRAVARRASFFPPRSDPYFERWMELLAGTK
jgi:hypothetical protein